MRVGHVNVGFRSKIRMNLQKKDEDADGGAIFLNLDRTTVLQQARVFNATPVKPRQCRVLLAKILSILYQQGQLCSSLTM